VLALGFLDLLGLLAVLALCAVWIARLCRRRLAWPFLAAALTGAALLTGFNWYYFYGNGTIIYTPTTAQVTGTWSGDYNETLTLWPNGTFTAKGVQIDDNYTDTSVPPPKAPVTGSGTWSIEPGSDASGEGGVNFTFTSCNAAPCPGSFELYAETSSPVSGRGPALFYYLGDPDDDDQYAFVLQSAPAPSSH
jgi:hypothetical protein